MLLKYFDKLVKHFGKWKIIHVSLTGGTVILLALMGIQILVPFSLQGSGGYTDNINDLAQMTTGNKNEQSTNVASVYRTGLFKGASRLNDKPIANKTIERIKSQLTLKCIMKMNGQHVAYINIKGVGLKKCNAGDSVKDLFTVLNINKGSVDISIVDHKLTLYL